MKPKRTQRPTAPSWQGKGVTAGNKATLGQAKPASHVTVPAQSLKPFAGRVFYLDLPTNRTAETLEHDIKELGGTVEKFFSKEIKYLVSNKREAKYVQCLRQDSPVPSPDSGQSSPQPQSNLQRAGKNGDNVKGRSQGQTETFVSTRGKSLVERVVKEQERIQMNKILSNALEWGVKILYIDDVMAYVQRKKKVISSQCSVAPDVKASIKAEPKAKQVSQKCKAGRISKPFIKVEDSSRHYRPLYLTMANMPELNLRTAPPVSPFCVEEKDPPGTKQRVNSEENAQGRKKNRDKKRGGYCECCMFKYENLTMHLQSGCHKAFSKSDKYAVVDRLVSTLHCNFIHIKAQIKRPKFSVSSFVVSPGPCGKTELRHNGDHVAREIIKKDCLRTVDEHRASFSGQASKMRSVSTSVSQNHRAEYRRSKTTHSDRSKQRSVTHKRPCRQNSLTSCTQRPETETAPSCGDCPVSVVSRGAQGDLVDQKQTEDMSGSTSCSNNMSGRTVASSKRLDEKKESDQKQDSLLCEVKNTLPDKETESNVSERDDLFLLAQSFPPVRRIQRRIRVYKRKRQKVESHNEPVRQSENSMQKLWDLFQSSEDTDIDFLGFED